MWSIIQIELYKIFKRPRTYIAFGAIAALIGVGTLLIKIVLFIFLFMWIRWTIPRFRYDELMNLGWKTMIPLALFNLLLTGAVILAKL